MGTKSVVKLIDENFNGRCKENSIRNPLISFLS